MTRSRTILNSFLQETASRLLSTQKQVDGEYWFAGEFPMTLRCPDSIEDFNFLSGYALLNIARAKAVLGSSAPASLQTMLVRGKELARNYRSPTGTLNWYSTRGTEDHIPANFHWGNNPVLSIRDDLDDTAIARLLTKLEPSYDCEANESLFPVVDSSTVLRESSKARLALAGVADGVYLSWILPDDARAPDNPGSSVAIPWENSVEMVTVAHIVAAIGKQGSDSSQARSKTFVNTLLSRGVADLLNGDAKSLAAAARYYPRVPFAPIAYALRAHVFCDSELLNAESISLCEKALLTVDPATRIASDSVAAELYFLWAAALLYHAGMPSLREPALDCATRLAEQIDDGDWPDTIFFHDAHIGHYSGKNHTAAVACEALALLIAAEVGK